MNGRLRLFSHEAEMIFDKHSVRWEDAEVKINWWTEFYGRRVTHFEFKFTGPDDPLLLALWARYREQMEAREKQVKEAGTENQQAMFF